MSYALDSHASDPLQRSADFNHFLITHPMAVAVCHDFAVSVICRTCRTCKADRFSHAPGHLTGSQ